MTARDHFGDRLRAAWAKRCEVLDMATLRAKPGRAEKACREFAEGFAAGWQASDLERAGADS